MGVSAHDTISYHPRRRNTKTETSQPVPHYMERDHPGFYVIYIAIDNGAGIRLPISTNFVTYLLTYSAMSWLFLEQVGEWLTILAVIAIEVVAPLMGLNRDFSFWFRMLASACGDWWKCLLFFLA